MSRKIDYIEAQYSKWIKEGRGSGEHQDYNPWLTVYDVLSDGCAHRVSGNCFFRNRLCQKAFSAGRCMKAIIPVR